MSEGILVGKGILVSDRGTHVSILGDDAGGKITRILIPKEQVHRLAAALLVINERTDG